MSVFDTKQVPPSYQPDGRRQIELVDGEAVEINAVREEWRAREDPRLRQSGT